MAVHGCIKKNILDHADEEESRNFKISSAISMPGQMGSPSDTPQPQNHEDSCLKPLSPKGENTYSRRSKVCPVAKVLMERSEATISRPETSDAHKTVSAKSHDNAMSDDSDDNKPLNFKFSLRGNKVSSSSKAVTQSSKLVPTNAQTSRPELSNTHNKILEKCHGKTATSDNSDDDKPLAFKLSSSRSNKTSSSGSAVAEGSDLIPKKASSSGLETSTAHGKDMEKFHGKTAQSDDSDGDVPLSSKLSSFSRSAKARTSMPSKKPSYYSNDDKPLSFSKSANISGARKNNSIMGNKVSGTSKANNMRDEKPSISKLSKSNLGSTEKSYDSCEKKALASDSQQNGSSEKDPSCISEKRPLDSADDSASLSNKKLKTSLPNALTNVKHEAVIKEERKTYGSDDDDDHIPLAHRTKKPATSSNQSSSKKKLKKVTSTSFKKGKKITKKIVNSKFSRSLKIPPGSGEGQKWTTLEHNGVIFPPPYKPHGVKMLYNGKPVDLTPEQEEVATMFAVMKDTEYATKKTFIDNYMNDWGVILGKNHVIKKFESCDFTPIYEWHMAEKEKKKQMSTEEKKALREEKLKQEEKYMWAIVDGVKEKVGNFRVEPPGLFRGRGEHPKMGKLKRRIYPRDITINIGKEAPIPKCPIPGERWKEIKHDNTVTWLAFWNDPINTKEFKYVFLAASSALKGQSDKEKYEKARKLKDYIGNIRVNYTKDFRSKDKTKQQIAVATYLIDKLALRAGNEKDDDEADTVGCCTLKVENVTLVPPNKLQFDFLGKDSIRYFNTVEVELPVYKAIGEFRKGGKKGSDDLFDKLDTSKLNAHLKELMPGLTAKVFRTYNASITLDEMLNKETKGDTVPEKIAVYQHANKEVAIICNHQRSVSKSHDGQMLRLDEKIKELKAQQDELKVDLSRARKGKPPLKDADGKTKRNLSCEAWEKRLMQVESRIEKIELDKKIKEDLKTVALGTSKINYLDPRISVAWCKRNEVPIEKIFNKSLLAKFCWAMDAEPSFRF